MLEQEMIHHPVICEMMHVTIQVQLRQITKRHYLHWSFFQKHKCASVHYSHELVAAVVAVAVADHRVLECHLVVSSNVDSESVSQLVSSHQNQHVTVYCHH